MIHRLSIPMVLLAVVLFQSCRKETDYSLTDADGNVYNKSVTIGTQVWMAENLKTTKFSNGDTIGTTSRNISDDNEPIYQWAYDGDESLADTYGRLYTWYVAADPRNVCPSGWHVPTDEDWTTLTTFLGGEDLAGIRLKEAGLTHWLPPVTGESTNESNFTALPGGCFYDGLFGYFGHRGFWWSSTGSSGTLGYFRTMSGLFDFVGRDGTNKTYGFSIRCIKDK